MLTAKHIAIAITLLWSMAAFSQETKKTDTPQKQAHKQEKRANNPEQALQEKPAPVPQTVNVIASGKVEFVAKNAEESGKSKNADWHSNVKLVLDLFLVIGTAAIGVFTARLFYVTRGLLGEAQKQFPHFKDNVQAATDASKAAKESVDLARKEFISTHRPKIRIKHIYPSPNHDVWMDRPFVVKLVIVNTGSTEATITEIGLSAQILLKGHFLPPRPDYTNVSRHNEKAGSGITFAFKPITLIDSLPMADNDGIRNGTRTLLCYGFVEYTDALGGIRKTAFCRRLEFRDGSGSNSSTGRLVPEGNPDYEYQD